MYVRSFSYRRKKFHIRKMRNKLKMNFFIEQQKKEETRREHEEYEIIE